MARRISVAPIIAWEEIGRYFERSNRLNLALASYNNALKATPPGGRSADRIGARIAKVELNIRVQEAVRAKPAETPPATAPEGAAPAGAQGPAAQGRR